MLEDAINHIRPTRAFDGSGWLESYTAKTQIFVGLELYDNEPSMTFRAEEDIRVGDLIEVPYVS